MIAFHQPSLKNHHPLKCNKYFHFVSVFDNTKLISEYRKLQQIYYSAHIMYLRKS